MDIDLKKKSQKYSGCALPPRLWLTLSIPRPLSEHSRTTGPLLAPLFADRENIIEVLLPLTGKKKTPDSELSNLARSSYF